MIQPKPIAQIVVRVNENVAARNTRLREPQKTELDKPATESVSLKFLRDCKMVE